MSYTSRNDYLIEVNRHDVDIDVMPVEGHGDARSQEISGAGAAA
jgi:hypothetical protein